MLKLLLSIHVCVPGTVGYLVIGVIPITPLQEFCPSPDPGLQSTGPLREELLQAQNAPRVQADTRTRTLTFTHTHTHIRTQCQTLSCPPATPGPRGCANKLPERAALRWESRVGKWSQVGAGPQRRGLGSPPLAPGPPDPPAGTDEERPPWLSGAAGTSPG